MSLNVKQCASNSEKNSAVAGGESHRTHTRSNTAANSSRSSFTQGGVVFKVMWVGLRKQKCMDRRLDEEVN